MNTNLTEIVCVIDRSGSMESICTDAIGGFNTWEFIFLAANQDAFATAREMSIDAQDTMSFAADSAGVRGGMLR